MTLTINTKRPYIDVDHYDKTDTSFSSATALEADVISMEVTMVDMRVGLPSFTFVLSNKDGKWESTFPAVPNESGLHDFIKIGIDGTTIGIFRINAVEPGSDDDGDILTIAGIAGEECNDRKCVTKVYRADNADDIIEDQLSEINSVTALVDMNTTITSIPNPQTEVIFIEVPTRGNMTVRDLVREVCEEGEYDAFFDSRTHPGTIRLVKKANTDVQLGTHLVFNKRDTNNNVKSGSEPRTSSDIINYITLSQGESFNTCVPHDKDRWTSFVFDSSETAWWIADTPTQTGVVQNTFSNVGISSISLVQKQNVAPGTVSAYLDISATAFGGNLDITSTGLDLDFIRVEHMQDTAGFLGDSPAGGNPILEIEDGSGNKVTRTLTGSEKPTWDNEDWNVGSPWTSWGGDTGTLDDTDIANIRFKGADTNCFILYIDGMYFYKTSSTSVTYLSDATSITDYGQKEMELQLPSNFVWRNMTAWGTAMLNKLKNPSRIVGLSVAGNIDDIDPPSVTEDDDSTPAPLFPGYSISFEADKWGIVDINTDANGTWWRLMKVVLNWDEDGFTVDLDITPTATEGSASEDYSYVYGPRYAYRRDPILGSLTGLMEQLKNTNKLAQDTLVKETVATMIAHSHTIADGSGPISTDINAEFQAILTQAATIAGSTALNNASFTASSIQSHSSGYSRGLYVSMTHGTNAVTGSGEINGLGVDVNATSNTPYLKGITIYTGALSSNTIDQIIGLEVYMDTNASATVNYKWAATLEMDNTAAPSVQADFIRLYSHGGAVNSVLWLAGRAADNAIEFLVDFEAPYEPWVNSLKSIKIKVGATTYYIPTTNTSGDLWLSGTLYVDTINEYTLNAGTTIEGVLLKDSDITISGTNYLYFRDAQIYLASLNDGYLDFEADTGLRFNAPVITNSTVTVGGNILSDAADTDSLGTTGAEWLNLYVGDAGKIYLGLGQDTSINRSGANVLTLTASNGVVMSEGLTVGSAIISDTADTDMLGTTGSEWLSLYLGDSGNIYFGIGQDVHISRSAANKIRLATDDYLEFRDAAIYITSLDDGHLDLEADTSIDLNATVYVDSLTASLLVSSNAGKQLASVSDLTAWVAGTANEITVTDDTDGTITLAIPDAVTLVNLTVTDITIGADTLDTNEWAFLNDLDQALKQADSPQFAGLTLTGALVSSGVGAADIGSTAGEVGDIFIADAKSIYLGSAQDIQLSRSAANKLLLASGDYLEFRDAAIYITSLDDGHLDLEADTSIDLNSKIVQAETITGGTAETAASFTVTDTHSHNAGYARGIHINYTHGTNAITGSGEINPLAVDMNATANVVNAFAMSIYTGTFAGATVSSLAGIYIYMDDSPNTISNKHALMLQMDCTTGSGTDAFVRLDGMGGTIDSVFWLTQAGGTATYMFDFEHSSTTPWHNASQRIVMRTGVTAYYIVTGSSTSRIEVGGSTYYIDNDGANNLTFTDPTSGTKTLAQLLAGVGAAPDSATYVTINAEAGLSAETRISVLGANDIGGTNWSITGATGALAVTSIDTGEGATEVFAMDQDVQVADNVVFATITVDNSGIHILDTGGDHDLILATGTDLSADKTLTFTTGDANRTITLSGNPTLSDWFDQAVKVASSPTFNAITATSIIIGVNTITTAEWAFLDGLNQSVATTSTPLFASITSLNFHIIDAGTANDLVFQSNSTPNLDADKTLTFDITNVARTITLSGNPTLADWFDQAVKVASGPTFASLILTAGLTVGSAIISDTTNTDALGSAAVTFADIFLGDGSIINLGEDQDVTLTHVADTGVLLNVAMQLQFRDANIYIASLDDGHLDLEADISLDMNAPVYIDGATASRLMSTGAGKLLASVTDLTGWIAGTANEIGVTDDTDGTVTLTLESHGISKHDNIARELWIQPSYALSTRTGTIGDHPAVYVLNDHDLCYFEFSCPDDFVSVTSLDLVVVPTNTAWGKNATTSDYAADDEPYNTHSAATGWSSYAGVTANDLYVYNDPLVGLVANLAKGDVVGIKVDGYINVGGGWHPFYILGAVLKYTGEQ